jgi:acyl-CoA thioester hydrolase
MHPVHIAVRSSDFDTNGHVRGSVYLDYAYEAGWELLRAAGIDLEELAASGLGPVNLETSVRFWRELRMGEAVHVSCAFVWSEGRTYRVEQELRDPDGALVAEVVSVSGLMSLSERRLVSDPGDRWRTLSRVPEVLGL